MGVFFVIFLLAGSRLMVRQVRYLVGLLHRFSQKDLSHSVELDSKDEFGDIARAVADSPTSRLTTDHQGASASLRYGTGAGAVSGETHEVGVGDT